MGDEGILGGKARCEGFVPVLGLRLCLVGDAELERTSSKGNPMSDLNLSVEDTELQLPDHGSFFLTN